MSAWYNYAAGGDRNFKITSPSLNIRQNAVGLRYSAHLKYPTLYASALITFNKGGYTKHYFEGTNRMCSKIGGGFSNINLNSIEDRVPTLVEDYDQLSEGQRESVERTFNECLNMGVEMDGIIDLYEVIAHESGRDDQEPAFFYHSDHLGSAAYLTNDAGQVTQTLNYLPYGEDWVDIQNYAETRYPRLGIYTYNGKEKDYESGFHYFGARYYWSELLTGWLSVDPMMDKYPGISPYNYCMWNPIKLIDPDGKEAAPPDRWTRIDPVISNKMFVGWDTEINNCFKLAQKQMGKKGVKGEYVKYKIYDEKKGANKKNTEKAVSYINQILEAGNPVMVGVDDQDGFAKSNGDESTDHWIVIVGRGNDNKGNYFLFYDNATGCGESGASDNNRLYYDADSGEIKGRADEKRNRYAAKRRDYIITQVMATTGVKKEEKKKGTNND